MVFADEPTGSAVVRLDGRVARLAGGTGAVMADSVHPARIAGCGPRLLRNQSPVSELIWQLRSICP